MSVENSIMTRCNYPGQARPILSAEIKARLRCDVRVSPIVANGMGMSAVVGEFRSNSYGTLRPKSIRRESTRIRQTRYGHRQ